MQSENNQHSDEEDYMGNIWGWKFSFISLGIIVAMVLLMWYRSVTIKQAPPSTPPPQEAVGDSTLLQ